jgi:hypothetical protein
MDNLNKIKISVTEYELKLIQYFIKEMPQEDDALFEEFEDYIDARCMKMEMDRFVDQYEESVLECQKELDSAFGKQS